MVEDTRFELGIPNRWSRDCPLGQGIALSEMQSFVFFFGSELRQKTGCPDADFDILVARARSVSFAKRRGAWPGQWWVPKAKWTYLQYLLMAQIDMD